MPGGPITWKFFRQNQTALSSHEAEILPTNECVKELKSVKHCDYNLGLISDNTHELLCIMTIMTRWTDLLLVYPNVSSI